MKHTSLKDTKLVIFDVDGTLYNQKKLRRYMMFDLCFYYLFRPLRIYEMKILWQFRKERERRAFLGETGIGENQYKWCQELVGRPLDEIRSVVDKWLFQRPLRFLPKCVFEEVKGFSYALREQGIKTAVYSDYRAAEKLEAMEISIDHIFSSEQREIDVLKPNPKGLNYIQETLAVEKENILFIGDREELDGACAKAAAMEYLIVSAENANDIFRDLKNQLK